MNKINRSSGKTRSEIPYTRADSAKEKKESVSHDSAVSPGSTAKDHVKKKTVRNELLATAKPTTQGPTTRRSKTSAMVPATPNDGDVASQFLRHTKTTASALAQLEKGIESIYRKDFKKALAELQSLVDKYPKEAEITASARSYLDICKREEERRKNTPATLDQSYALGVLEHNRNNYDEAIVYFQQSLEKYPRSDYIYYSIAAALALKGDTSAAIENLRKAVDLNRDSWVHAKSDPDFVTLADCAEFLELVGAYDPRQT